MLAVCVRGGLKLYIICFAQMLLRNCCILTSLYLCSFQRAHAYFLRRRNTHVLCLGHHFFMAGAFHTGGCLWRT
jgi:hypothetical protein